MADAYVVSGAGDAAFNGVYVEDGTYAGHTRYSLAGDDATRYLYWFATSSVWALCANLSALSPNYLGGASLPGTWTTGSGTAPAPSVTLSVPPSPGIGDVTVTLDTLVVDTNGDLLGTFHVDFDPVTEACAATCGIGFQTWGDGGEVVSEGQWHF